MASALMTRRGFPSRLGSNSSPPWSLHRLQAHLGSLPSAPAGPARAPRRNLSWEDSPHCRLEVRRQLLHLNQVWRYKLVFLSIELHRHNCHKTIGQHLARLRMGRYH